VFTFLLVYNKNLLDVDCQTQGRLKFMIKLYFSEKSVINSKYNTLEARLVTFPSSANLTTSPQSTSITLRPYLLSRYVLVS
jgi:hypothetical protein